MPGEMPGERLMPSEPAAADPMADPALAEPGATGRSRRHPRWGVVAQVAAVAGAVALVIAIAVIWVVYDTAAQRIDGVMAELDAVVAEAQGKYDAAGAALDAQSGVASNPDAQAVLQDGADLLRSVGALMDSLVTRIGDSVDGLLAALLAVIGVLTVLLGYLLLVHGGIWTLGRHWRRD